MDAIRQALTLIGAGTVLGGVLWALDTWTTGLGPAWIIVGVVIAVGGAAAWKLVIANRPLVTAPTPPPPAPPSDSASNTTDLDLLRAAMRAYGTTAFAAVGLFLIGLSLEPAETSVRYLPAIKFADFVYAGLASSFFVIALTLLAGASLPPATRWFARHQWSFRWMEFPVGLVAWAGVTIGWLGNLSTAVTLPAPLPHAYFYGGSLVFLLLGALLVWDGVNFRRKNG